MWLLFNHCQEGGQSLISPVQAWVGERTGLKEKLNREALRVWQIKKVKDIIEYARNNSSFYNKRLADVDVSAIQSMNDLSGIPFTYPEDIITDPTAFICIPQREVSRISSFSTSGSLGTLKRIYFSENDLERTIDFFAHGMSTMVQSGQTTLILMSSSTEYSIGDMLQKGLKRIGVSSVIHGNVKDVPAALGAARGFDCLVGVPAEILYLCREDASLRPKSVLLSADYVPESIIKTIEETWNCQVFTHYGMTEMGYGGGVQCKAGLGYHLRDADLLIEIVDSKTGENLPNGKYGEIVITTLQNEAMPLIRYRTGDIARMITDSCPCGGILPRLDKVIGRKANTILLEDGSSISIHVLDEIMFSIPELRGYKAKLIGSKILVLTVDIQSELDANILMKKLPNNLEIIIEYNLVPPYSGPEKRCIFHE